LNYYLDGFELLQSWQSYVYHLTARAGQFQHGKLTTDDSQKSQEWKELMNNSTKEFIRKWGTLVQHDKHMLPIVSPKYDIGFVVKNCDLGMLNNLEPWCSTIYVDCDTFPYIEWEQQKTTDDLSKKVLPIDAEKTNDIIVSFDQHKLTQGAFEFLQKLPHILEDSGEIGSMEYDIFEIKIDSLESYEKDLIKCPTI